MLTNDQMDAASPMACLLIGQPTLRRMLRLGVLAALDQRIGLRYAMLPMTSQETGSYITHHLKLAGRSDPLVSDDAITLIHEAARGLPRAGEREQFGRPIGSFQAVAHQCADMLADLQSANAAARYAAVATAAGSADAALAARVAALRGGESYRRVTEAAIHLLGGVGFSWEHDAHLYYRRAWSAQALAGGPQAHRAAIAALAGL